MKFKIASDFHSEFYYGENDEKFKRILNNYFPENEDDKETILLLAGDIGTYKNYEDTYRRIFNMLSKRFKKVICVPGNHSWYKSEVWGMEKDFFKSIILPKNVHYMDDDALMLDKNTMVIGSCLWTDFDNENPMIMMQAQNGMNDYNLIRHGYQDPADVSVYSQYHKKTIQASDVLEKHKKSKEFIIGMLNEANKMGVKNKIIVSHHAPTFQSVDGRYRDDRLNGAYCTNLEYLMKEYDVTLFVHGHMHCTNDYMVDNTRVICNALGYHNYEINPKFNSNLIVEI